MRKKTQKQQRRSSSDSLIKTGKKRDIELAEDELNRVTGGETKTISITNDPLLTKGGGKGDLPVDYGSIKTKY